MFLALPPFSFFPVSCPTTKGPKFDKLMEKKKKCVDWNIVEEWKMLKF